MLFVTRPDTGLNPVRISRSRTIKITVCIVRLLFSVRSLRCGLEGRVLVSLGWVAHGSERSHLPVVQLNSQPSGKCRLNKLC